jgi:hypothetical protein
MPLSRVSPARGHSYYVDYLLLIFGCLGLAILVVRKERQRGKERQPPALRPKAEEIATPAHAADSIRREPETDPRDRRSHVTEYLAVRIGEVDVERLQHP